MLNSVHEWSYTLTIEHGLYLLFHDCSHSLKNKGNSYDFVSSVATIALIVKGNSSNFPLCVHHNS